MKTEAVQGFKIQAGEKVPVFPLPNSILFPHVELPLYIFEPRYRKMLKDCLHGNNLMAISLLKKGWESEKEPYPSYDTVSVGYVKLSTQNSDGTSNIILKGMSRAKISEYLQWDPYRIAKITPIDSHQNESKDIGWRARKLSQLFVQKLFLTTKIREEDVRSLEKITDPEELSDLVAFTANVDFHIKQELLETLDLDKRLERLIQILESEMIDIKRRNN
jgi:Lon protease-like protein